MITLVINKLSFQLSSTRISRDMMRFDVADLHCVYRINEIITDGAERFRRHAFQADHTVRVDAHEEGCSQIVPLLTE